MFFVIVVILDIALLFAAAHISRKQSSAAVIAWILGLALAIVFTPGVLIGHGPVVFPAFLAMLFQPESIIFNLLPFLVVFGVTYAVVWWRKRKRVVSRPTAAQLHRPKAIDEKK